MGTCPKKRETFVDLDKCINLIDELNNKLIHDDQDHKSILDAEKLVEDFRKIIDVYQEQPELLDPYLHDLISRLTSNLTEIKSSSSNRYHTIFKFLYQLIKVTGFKSIGKKFPNETDKLLLLIELLYKEDTHDKVNWQTRFVLTVWLSIIILTPFDLKKFQSSSSETSVLERIYNVLMRNLTLHDSCQHATAFCLAKLFSRSDVYQSHEPIEKFITTVINELNIIKSDSIHKIDDVKLIGYLRTCAYMFKFLPRTEMKKYSHRLIEILVQLDIETINRELINHLIIKLTQRCGLALLPRRIAQWRYKRGSRILGESLKSISESKPACEQTADEVLLPEDNEEEVTSSEQIESILSVLFVAAQNAHTRVRLSASKGIARLASRLSRERVGDIVDMVAKNFFDPVTASEFAWHGGCLTFAEMSRFGLILEEKMSTVTRIVSEAIIYDRIKGSFAVGAHVRESACYVFWAMSRTYEDHLLLPYIESISVNLLCTMLFDRELQCRRAASATFQELVGRQGTYNEEGISILTDVDYQNVGQIQMTYLQLSPKIASYGSKYSESFVRHLLDRKMGHWDIKIRRLTSNTLSALMLHSKVEFVNSIVLTQLIKYSEQDSDNNAKHGAILSLAAVIRGLVPLQHLFDTKLIEFVGNLAEKCDNLLKSKQQGPNFIEAIGQIIQTCEIASFNFDDGSKTVKQWESIALSALDSDNSDIRDIGSDALLTLYRFYYKSNKTCQDRLLTILNKSLASLNESSRCGCLKALSKLGLAIGQGKQPQQKQIQLDADTPDIILMSLSSYIGKPTREQPSDVVFAQAKAEACEALVNFVRSIDKSRLIVSSALVGAGLDALIERSQDYTSDKRGDIGVIVRKAAIKSLQELTLYLLSIGMASTLDGKYNRVGQIIARTLQQAISYNNSAREIAAISFYRLITNPLLHQYNLIVPHKEEILNLFDTYQVNDSFNWRDDSTPIFVTLLDKPEYSRDIWIGLVVSVGQVSDLCAKQFRDALSNYILNLLNGKASIDCNDCEKRLDFIYNSLLTTLKENDRLIGAGLIVIDYLLTKDLLSKSSEQFQIELVEFCWSLRKPVEAKKLISIARILSSMLQFSGKIQTICLSYCLQLLSSGYAKVRAFTAEQLYLSIMTYQEELEQSLGNITNISEQESAHEGDSQTSQVKNVNIVRNDINLTEAMDLLSQTNWSDPLDKVKPILNEICSKLLVNLSSN